MSYLRRFPPQGGRSGTLLHLTAPDLPEGWSALAALLWKNGITAIADLREHADDGLKKNAEDSGVAYGRVEAGQQRQRLSNAEARYRTLVVSDPGRPVDSRHPLVPLDNPSAEKA